MKNEIAEQAMDAFRKMLSEIFYEGIARALQGEEEVDITHNLTLYENSDLIKAELGIELRLKAKNK